MTAFPRSSFEEALTLELAVQRYAPDAEFAASELTALADTRALPGPVDPAGRDFPTEAREELADARNYLVWHHRLRRLADAADDELAAIERTLAALAIAWQELGHATTASSLGTDAPPSSGRAGGTGRSTERQPTAAHDTGRPRAALPSCRRSARADRPPPLAVFVGEPEVIGALSCSLSDCVGLRLYKGGGSVTCITCLKSISEDRTSW